MNAADWIILLVIIAAVIAAVRSVKKGGSCSCGCGSSDSPAPVRVHDRNPNHYSHEALIRIEGMHCSNCAVKVDNALNQMEGVWSTTSLGEKQADVLMKEPLEENLLKQKIREAGYIVSSVTWKS